MRAQTRAHRAGRGGRPLSRKPASRVAPRRERQRVPCLTPAPRADPIKRPHADRNRDAHGDSARITKAIDKKIEGMVAAKAFQKGMRFGIGSIKSHGKEVSTDQRRAENEAKKKAAKKARKDAEHLAAAARNAES